MREVDLLTEGERERRLMARLRRGDVAPDELEAACLPFPTKLQIQTTTFCNASCTTCPYPETSRELEMGTMRREVFDRVVQQIRGRAVERVSLFLMNEPTVDRRLEDLTVHLKREEPSTCATIITNGKLLDGDRAERLAAAGMDEIGVSVNGFTAAAHGSVMVGLDFGRIVRNLEQIGERLRQGRLGSMQVRVLALDMGDARERAAEFEARIGIRVFLKPVTNRAGAIDTTRLGACPATALQAMPQVCQRPFVKAYVLWNGDLVLCNSDWRRTTILGNLMREELADLWLGAKLMQIRRHHLRQRFPDESPCSRCDYPYLIDA